MSIETFLERKPTLNLTKPAVYIRPPVAMDKTHYDGAEQRPFLGRPGANDALTYPSRVGDTLRYRDGRVEKIT